LQKLPEVASWKEISERVTLRVTQVLVACYLAAAVGAWTILKTADESSWLFTLLLLGPRWFALLPLVVLAPLALLLRIRLLLPLGLAATVIAWGVVGFYVPWPWKGGDPDTPEAVRVVTCDVGGQQRRQWQHLRRLIDDRSADVVALQQAGSGMLLIVPENWHVAMDEQLLIASRYPIERTEVCRRDHSDPTAPPLALYVLLQTPTGKVGVCNLNLSAPDAELTDFLSAVTQSRGERHAALATVLRQQYEESQRVSVWAQHLPQLDIVLGSFHSPVESRAYRCWAEYRNAFAQAGSGLGNTQRVAAQALNYGLRTDHILIGPTCRSLSCEVDSLPGADHRPVFAAVAISCQ
jgi:endonuclease/exonuclease/phosphatase family metal-dependent hydrolase